MCSIECSWKGGGGGGGGWKEFTNNGMVLLVNIHSYCDDYEVFQQDDKDCWTGEAVGQYLQTVMEPGMTTQKYNPEVPYEGEGFRVNSQVNELVDKLIANRQKMSNVVSVLK